MPEEIAVIIVFSIIAGTLLAIIKAVLNYKSSQQQAMPGRGGSALTAGELRDLMREAVEEANAPLVERLDAVEAGLDALAQPRLAPAREAPLLEAPLEEAVPATPRRRVT